MTAGDTAKPIEGILTDEKGAVSLLGVTVRFLMKPAPNSGLTTPLLNKLAVAVAPNAPVGHADYGKARYFFLPSETVPGVFQGQFKATWGDGGVEYFPSGDEFIEIIVGRALDGP